MEGPAVIESLTTAPHPTVIGLQKPPNTGSTVPVYANDAFETATLSEGIWHGARRFLEESMEILPHHIGDSGYGIAYLETVLQRLLREPDETEARYFGDILHAEGFGVSRAVVPIAKPPDKGERTGRNLHQSYLRSRWRKGFLRRLSEDEINLLNDAAKECD
jgi:hypothetical protein